MRGADAHAAGAGRGADVSASAPPSGGSSASEPSLPSSRTSGVESEVAGWVEPEWAESPLCPEVRALIGLAPGPELAAALAVVPMVQVCPAGPRFHAGSALDAAVVFPEPPGSGQRAGASGDCDPCDAPAPSDPSGPSDPPAPSGPSGPSDPSGPDPSWGPVLGRGGRGFPVPGSVAGFPCCCQLLLAAAWEAQAAWTGVQAGRALLSAAGADPVAATPGGFAPARVLDRARDELSGVLRISPHSVSYRLRAARALEPQTTDGDADDSGSDAGAVGSGLRVSALGALVDEGLLFSSGLRAITSAASELPAGVRVAVHDGMAGRIRQRRAGGRASWPAWELRRIALALALSLTPPPGDDPDGDADGDARGRAFAQRRVTVSEDVDGMAWVSALIDAVDAHRIDNRLSAAAAAAHAGGAGRRSGCTRDRHRADVFVATLLARTPARPDDPADAHGGTDGGHDGCDGARGPEPSGGGPDPGRCPAVPAAAARPDIHVVIDAPTLVGLAHNPAHVPGLGPIPAPLGRALAAQGRWRLLLTDAAGLVTAVSSRTYAPSAAVARLVRAREATCRWPGCTRSSESCDLDHTIAFPDGDTVPANMGPLCRRHHNLKTHHGYVLTNLPPPDDRQREREPGNDDDSPPGPLSTAWRWTTPAGLTHTRHPQPPLDG